LLILIAMIFKCPTCFHAERVYCDAAGNDLPGDQIEAWVWSIGPEQPRWKIMTLWDLFEKWLEKGFKLSGLFVFRLDQ
jgi:hypothetical protein